ncbi:MAG: nucleotide sugar dehydrogenase [Candidatus Hodarchaeales archaeon]|jgi:UDP-N-acetyl-D-mannosaminuronic acid dehydrogenase
MKIVVFGMGYVGIPCAALLANVEGFEVVGVQRRSKRSGWKIECLNSGKSPFEGDEPGLADLISEVVKKGTFSVTDDPSVAAEADVILIDVQTPTDYGNIPHYESLKEVSQQIGSYLAKDTLIVVESTVAPGTTQNIVLPILEKNSGLKGGSDFSLAFSFERVMPGHLLDYIVNMPRVVGGIDSRSTNRAVELYSKIVKEKISKTDCLTAELTKTIENAYRDINIAFANEMALICESLGSNVYEIRDLINVRHDRDMHIPGAGVGGHCLPKDTWLLRYGLLTYGVSTREPEFIALGRRINDFMPIHLAGLVENALLERERSLPNSKIAVLGLAYLENSDDTRNTPAIPLISALEAKDADVIVHDPYVRNYLERPLKLTNKLLEAVDGADCIVIVTKHQEYFDIDLSWLIEQMRTPIIIDGRNVFDQATCKKAGFLYQGVGKGEKLKLSSET